MDLVLQGHDHAYLRTGLEVPGDLAQSLDPHKGSTVYVVSVSGSKMYPVERQGFYRRIASGVQLFQVVEVDRRALRYQARLATGELYDAFTLQVDANGERELVDQLPDIPEILEEELSTTGPNPKGHREPLLVSRSSTESQRIDSPLTGHRLHFGETVSISGDVAVVASAFEAEAGGAVHVYRYSGHDWIFEQRLAPEPAIPALRFGRSVAVNGDRIVVGTKSLARDPQCAYVYRYHQEWSLEQILTPADFDTPDRCFGAPVVIEGDIIGVGDD